MPQGVNYICIEGVIGVGKTSLCELLAQTFGVRPLLEAVEENPFLQGFYRDKKEYAFQTQLWFLLSRYRQNAGELIQQDIFHQGTIADYMFAKDRIFASINLDENELVLYDSVARLLERKVPKPDLVIYLQASVDTLLKRIQLRGRPYESSMEREYLETLATEYNRFFFHYTDSPVLIINTTDIDFVNYSFDLDEIVAQIVKTRSGVNYFHPMGISDRLRIEDRAKRKETR